MINDVLVSSSCSNDHKLSGLNNTNLFSYRAGGQKSEMSLTGPKIMVLAGLCSFWNL